MKTHHIADATRIWQEENTNEEHECPTSFLWADVVKVESAHGTSVTWQNTAPKTFITLGGESDSTFCVLGPYKRWRDRWGRFFQAERDAALLPFLN